MASNLFGKIAGQLGSGGGRGAGEGQNQQGGSGGLLHKVTDMVSGKQHPQDLQRRPEQQGYGSGKSCLFFSWCCPNEGVGSERDQLVAPITSSFFFLLFLLLFLLLFTEKYTRSL
jgi:hypothetical protein